MDYETADGSQFVLLEIFADDENGEPVFQYTSVTAVVEGEAYAGKLDQAMEDVDEIEALECIQPVPAENLYPLFPPALLKEPIGGIALADLLYIKSPSFTYEDSLPGCTFVADCLLNEVAALETLRQHRHPNIAKYEGCIVKEGRITQIVLKRYPHNLTNLRDELPKHKRQVVLDGITSAMRHLHKLGLAHNDISPRNVCLMSDGTPVLVDFDSCLPFGEKLMKGTAGDGEPVSSIENDLGGLADLGIYLGFVEDTANLAELLDFSDGADTTAAYESDN